MDNLLIQKKAQPILVVIRNSNLSGRNVPDTFNETSLCLFESELKQVLPLVESNFQVVPDPAARRQRACRWAADKRYTLACATSISSPTWVFNSGFFADNPSFSDPQHAFTQQNATIINQKMKQLWRFSMSRAVNIAYANNQVMRARPDAPGIWYAYRKYPGGCGAYSPNGATTDISLSKRWFSSPLAGPYRWGCASLAIRASNVCMGGSTSAGMGRRLNCWK